MTTSTDPPTTVAYHQTLRPFANGRALGAIGVVLASYVMLIIVLAIGLLVIETVTGLTLVDEDLSIDDMFG